MTLRESVRGTSVMNEIRWYSHLEEATFWFEKYKIYKTVENNYNHVKEIVINRVHFQKWFRVLPLE